jgi:hypothetical protein
VQLPSVERLVNVSLLSSPVSWAVVWSVATIWLLLFHVVMQAWKAMRSTGQAAYAAPGQVAFPTAGTTAYSTPGTLTSGASSLSGFAGADRGEPTIWTDGTESRYAEDGWTSAY